MATDGQSAGVLGGRGRRFNFCLLRACDWWEPSPFRERITPLGQRQRQAPGSPGGTGRLPVRTLRKSIDGGRRTSLCSNHPDLAGRRTGRGARVGLPLGPEPRGRFSLIQPPRNRSPSRPWRAEPRSSPRSNRANWRDHSGSRRRCPEGPQNFRRRRAPEWDDRARAAPGRWCRSSAPRH